MISANTYPQAWLFPPSLQVAADIQKQMAQRVITSNQFAQPRYIAGMDVSNNPYDPAQLIYASVVLLDALTLEIIQTTGSVMQQRFPYVPGFLGFREAPALVEAYHQLHTIPDLIFVDGHGTSHPRGLGIASHIGVLLDRPSIGVAKTILVGKPATTLDSAPGASTALIWRNNILGTLLRSKQRCNPLIISCGHRVALSTAVQQVQHYLRGYRLPEPTRQAHLAANALRSNYGADALEKTESAALI